MAPRRDTTWTQSVPFSVFESLGDAEIKRQESIFEFIQAENNYVQDMEALSQYVVVPLLAKTELPEAAAFLKSLCLSISLKIATEHCSVFAKRLLKKQSERKDLIIGQIGQELITFYGSPSLIALHAEYAEGYVYAKDFLAKERKRGSDVVKWIDETGMRNPIFRKLPIDSFITPSSRLTKSKLQIEAIIKHTMQDNPDTQLVQGGLHLETLILSRIDRVIGDAQNHLKISRLQQDLDAVLSDRDKNEIRLWESGRRCVRDGRLLLKRSAQSEVEYQVVLVDNALIIYRDKGDVCKVKAIIPLPLLKVSAPSTASKKSPGHQPVSRKNSIIEAAWSRKQSLMSDSPQMADVVVAAVAANRNSMQPVDGNRRSMDWFTLGVSGAGSGATDQSIARNRSTSSEMSRLSRCIDTAPNTGGTTKTTTLHQSSSVQSSNFSINSLTLLQTPASTDKSCVIVFTHTGRSVSGLENESYTLLCTSESERRGWVDAIEEVVRESTAATTTGDTPHAGGVRFRTEVLSDGFFGLGSVQARVLCSTSFGAFLVVGTESGLFVSRRTETLSVEGKPSSSSPSSSSPTGDPGFIKVLDLERVLQVEVLAPFDLLLVLSDKTLYSFPVAVLETAQVRREGVAGQTTPTTPTISEAKGKKVGSSISFFKSGVCADKVLVCAVKSTSLSSTIKVFEPVGGVNAKRSGGLAAKIFKGGGKETMKVYKEFYIPTESNSIIFLKTKLCVGCTKGFEIVDLETLNTQGLLDPSDSQLSFVVRENMKPISLFRVRDEFGFYVDKLGRRSKPKFLVSWSGFPSAFSYREPYVIAYSAAFIEIRNVETGVLRQVIEAGNLRVLNASLMQCAIDGGAGDFQHLVFVTS